jgi:hypothetical protein
VLEDALAVQHDEDLLLRRVAVRRRAAAVRVEPDPVQTSAHGAGLSPELLGHTPVFVLGAFDVDDVRRPRRRLRQLGLARSRLALPRVRPRREVERDAHPHDLRPREVRRRRVGALAEGEDVQAAITGAKGVRLLGDALDDAVAGAHLVRRPALPREPRAGEHEVDLLFVELDMRRRRPPPRVHLDAGDADVARAGGAPEVEPRPGEMALHRALALDLVPVSDHSSSSPSQ